MYSLRAVLDKQPVQISGAAFAVVNLFVASGVVHVSGALVAAANTALALVLGLFVQTKTANKSVLNELADALPAPEPAKPARRRP